LASPARWDQLSGLHPAKRDHRPRRCRGRPCACPCGYPQGVPLRFEHSQRRGTGRTPVLRDSPTSQNDLCATYTPLVTSRYRLFAASTIPAPSLIVRN
jgi:hypothetical protein